MMFVVFDFDGTLALIEHRRHFIAGPKKDYDAFFDACLEDSPNWPVVSAFEAHVRAGHRVEIWSGRSDVVRDKSETWLRRLRIDPTRLTRMRRNGDYTKDYVLKEQWLHASDPRPDLIFDDRQSVVDMWRRNGVACFQVAPGDFDKPKTIAPLSSDAAILHMLIGPSGAGKSSYAAKTFEPEMVLSSDKFRQWLCGDFRVQERNADVFAAMQNIASERVRCGVPTAIDATNIKRKDRLAFVDLVPRNMRIQYIVIDRTLQQKIATAGWRAEVKIGDQSLIERHHAVMQSNVRDILAGDQRANVDVLDLREISP
jgi:predicted kinase